eukprot:6975611-Prymnesium_polylepis.1
MTRIVRSAPWRSALFHTNRNSSLGALGALDDPGRRSASRPCAVCWGPKREGTSLARATCCMVCLHYELQGSRFNVHALRVWWKG